MTRSEAVAIVRKAHRRGVVLVAESIDWAGAINWGVRSASNSVLHLDVHCMSAGWLGGSAGRDLRG